jgi:hypothetical protein
MKEYFTLQIKMLNRQLTEFGIEPLIGYIIGIVAFILVSFKLYERTQYAEYILIFISLSITIKLSEICRNDFLKLCYPKNNYFKIRTIENLFVSLPFIIMLVYQKNYLSSVVLLIISCLLIVIDFKKNTNFTIPTPFYKHPFEFTVGFRTNFLIYLFAYFLTIMSLISENFNLGIFSLIIALIASLNYYTNLENEFYIWIFSLTPKEFIKYKLKNIINYSTLLSLPIIISLSVSFYKNIDVIIGIQCLGYLFIFTTMLAKYSIFPEKLNIRFGILLAMTIWLPPLLLIIIPYLHHQSVKKLNEIL